MFGDFGNDNNDEDNNADEGWADGFGDDSNTFTLEFAESALTEVQSDSAPGKQKKTGLRINGAVNYVTSKSQL